MTSPSNSGSHPRRNGSTSGTGTTPFNPAVSHGASSSTAFSPPANSGYRASGSSQSTRSSTSTAINPLTSSHMESTVTRLLVATKQLLESLTDWSHGRIDESGVSDIYVRLGNEFNAASLAFSKEGIDMNDLNSVPDDLRNCLEAALSEDASPMTLEQHLPQIRQIVVHLLQGLKVKQSKWRAAKRQQEVDLAHTSIGSLPNRPHGRDNLPPDRLTGAYPSSVRAIPVSRTLSAAKSREDLRRSAVSSSPNAQEYHRPPRPASPGPYPASRLPTIESVPSKSHDPSRIKSPSEATGPESSTGTSSKPRVSPVNRAVRSVNEFSERLRGNRASPPPAGPPLPTNAASAFHNASNPANYTIPIPPVPPPPRPDHLAQASSLEALRKTDTLQRRASKRFSTYTYNKIAATTSPHKRSGEGQAGHGLGINVPALPRSPSQIALLVPRDDDDGAREATEAGRELVRRAKGSTRSDQEETPDAQISSPSPVSRSKSSRKNHDPEVAKDKTTISPILEETDTSIHIQLSTPVGSPTMRTANLPMTSTPPINTTHSSLSRDSHTSTTPTIFLQLGRDVKKAKLETSPTIASLRILFMERFQYSPGLDDFPTIYIRDPQCGVQYQLEDMSEVKDRVVLSLNIDVLDQVKSHIDTGLSGLARELKDLKSSITTLRRQSVTAAASNSFMIDNHSTSASPALRPTDSQFKNVARHMLQRVNTGQSTLTEVSSIPPRTITQIPMATVTSPILSPAQPNSAASFSELRLQQISSTFKNQFTEVQDLRRELGVLRQLYSTFSGETKDMLGTLRSQAEQVKQVASTKIAAPRTSINVGKVKLETRSQDLVTKIESLQDTVEDLKQDVTNRKIRPRPATMKSVAESISAVNSDLEELTSQITQLKPSWKKSWEEELQNIVDEQQLLNYQEDLVKDLKEDLVAVSGLFGHVKDYLDVRKVSKFKPREFIPIGGNGFGGGLNSIGGNPREGLETVLMQVKALEPKSEPRLKAIEAAEKMREKNLKESGKDDEFALELAGFVGGKKLKMTGGTEETERMRKIKSEQTLKAMILGTGMNEVPGAGSGSGSVPLPTMVPLPNSYHGPIKVGAPAPSSTTATATATGAVMGVGEGLGLKEPIVLEEEGGKEEKVEEKVEGEGEEKEEKTEGETAVEAVGEGETGKT